MGVVVSGDVHFGTLLSKRKFGENSSQAVFNVAWRDPHPAWHSGLFDRDAVECRTETVEIVRSEHDARAGRDVDQVEVDPGRRDHVRQLGQLAGTIVDVDDHDLALAGDRRAVHHGQSVANRLGVRDEDVQLGALTRTERGRRCDVDPGVAQCARHPGE